MFENSLHKNTHKKRNIKVSKMLTFELDKYLIEWCVSAYRVQCAHKPILLCTELPSGFELLSLRQHSPRGHDLLNSIMIQTSKSRI